MPPILDVAIGLLFIYLLFSLIVTAARELCAAFATSTNDKRALLLKEGIGELFCDMNEKNGFSEKFFAHPLISALSPSGKGAMPNYIPRDTFVSTVLDLIAEPKLAGPRTAEQVLAGIFGSVKPVFIERATAALRALRARYAGNNAVTQAITDCLGMVDIAASAPAQRQTFSTALDIIKDKVATDCSTAKGDRDGKKTALDQSPNDVLKKQALADAEAKFGELEGHRLALQTTATLLTKVDEAVAAAASAVDDKLRRTLAALFEDAGRNPEEFEKQLGAWFDRSMDRVTGWYKKYTQAFTLVLGLVLAISCNVDSLRIVDVLSTDPKLREAIVQSASDYVNRTSVGTGKELSDATARLEAATQVAESEPDGAQKIEAQKTVAKMKAEVDKKKSEWDTEVANAIKSVEAAEKLADQARKDAKEAKDTSDAVAKDSTKDKAVKEIAKTAAEKAEAKAQKAAEAVNAKKDELTSLKSWGGSSATDRLANTVRQMNGFGLPIGWHKGDWDKAFADFPSGLRTILGWVLTALAASLGAPFWFDTLNKIVTIRAGGRAPEEKNPGENGDNQKKKDSKDKS
ncbi:MAG: hypothetical protein ABJF10_12885 [Chthoniobacter sp.]|uniref:hypothetical protein n=1 Tax=Chthoniobacter sp. TaxID=2510640 RepID=UPI0032AD85AA